MQSVHLCVLIPRYLSSKIAYDNGEFRKADRLRRLPNITLNELALKSMAVTISTKAIDQEVDR